MFLRLYQSPQELIKIIIKLLLNKIPQDEEIKSVFTNLRIKHLFERLILNDEKIGSSIEFSGISGGELKRIFLSFYAY